MSDGRGSITGVSVACSSDADSSDIGALTSLGPQGRPNCAPRSEGRFPIRRVAGPTGAADWRHIALPS